MWSLQTAKIVIIIAGCLDMIYTQSTTSVASIEFARELGGTGLHIGILGALPTGMLFMQFLSAYLVNKMRYRRRLWMSLSVMQRAICIPVAAGPWLFPEISDAIWLWAFLIVSAVNQGALHFCTPLWLSWMGDYLPHVGLNRYWGIRHLWMQAAAALSLGGIALILTQTSLDIIAAFALIVAVGGVLGVIDVCLFFRVDEPEVTHLPQATLREILSGPIRHRGFRSFIGFTCYWHIATMVGAPFISLYLLSDIGMSLPQVLLLWTIGWIGGAISSRWLGRMAEDHGNRPILVICTALKSINMIALLITPREPSIALLFLIPVFMFDMALNTGFAIANNGFLLKNSPAANRTMFIAAGTAIAGLCGGVIAIMSGIALSGMEGWSTTVGSMEVNGFHVLFLVSLMLRFIAVGVVQGIHEPDVRETSQVMTLLIGVTPLRVLRYPIGMYRWMSTNNKETATLSSAESALNTSENPK